MSEQAPLLRGAGMSASPDTSSFAARWSVGDGACSLLLLALALWADSWPPFERDVRPQLNDPSIMYPHTPPLAQQVPSWLLWRLSVALPLLLLLPLAAPTC